MFFLNYIDYFTNNIPYDYWPWSICRIFDVVSNANQIVLNNEQHNKEGIYVIDNKKYQLLQGVFGRNYYENISVYNNKTLLWARTNVWNSDGHDFW